MRCVDCCVVLGDEYALGPMENTGSVSVVGGDLLRSGADALVNPVNTVGVMGRGLAAQFKRAYPDNYLAYRAACRAGRVRIGEMFVVGLGLVSIPRWIINFPTKRHWREPSRLADIELGLDDLCRVILELGMSSVAVPALGCGLGGLDWTEVELLIHERLRDCGASVFVYGPQ